MAELQLPGFRFHPTEEELLNFYLRRIATGKKLRFDVIGFLNIYQHDPSDLPRLAKTDGEREWYFFVPRDRRHGNGGRPNRITENGFWKATGSDRQIRNLSDPKKILGLKKTLVFYKGRAPRGCKTDWVMNEYRLPDTCPFPKEDIVLCKIYRKATSLRVLEQRAAMGEQSRTIPPAASSSSQSQDTLSSHSSQENCWTQMPLQDKIFEAEEEEHENKIFASSLGSGFEKDNLKGLEVPKLSMDWTLDPFWAQLRSPWLDHWSPHANVLNF